MWRSFWWKTKFTPIVPYLNYFKIFSNQINLILFPNLLLNFSGFASLSEWKLSAIVASIPKTSLKIFIYLFTNSQVIIHHKMFWENFFFSFRRNSNTPSYRCQIYWLYSYLSNKTSLDFPTFLRIAPIFSPEKPLPHFRHRDKSFPVPRGSMATYLGVTGKLDKIVYWWRIK